MEYVSILQNYITLVKVGLFAAFSGLSSAAFRRGYQLLILFSCALLEFFFQEEAHACFRWHLYPLMLRFFSGGIGAPHYGGSLFY